MTSNASINQRLTDMGLVLPTPPEPVACYVPAVISAGHIHVSGQIPLKDGQLMATGPVPTKVTIEQAQAAARQCAINAIAVLAGCVDGDLDRIQQIVRLGVFVQCEAGFADQPIVANGASELIGDLFGASGRHARAAVGVNALPLNATVEVELMARFA
ncbi:MAG: hypothetical protein CMJ32_10825 [Phycisphaerae bacterium]|nr:hypothetical protein [Phycisphaerae bacterium]